MGILYIIGGIFGVLLFIAASKKNKPTNNKPIKTEPINKPTIDHQTSFQTKQIQGQGIQFLESINIIQTTKNLDTLRSRISFIDETLYPNIISNAGNNRYKIDIQKSIDDYKTLYYDKTLNEIQTNLLVNPNNTELKKLYADSIVQCYIRYVDNQKEEISKLIRESAIEKRKEFIIQVGYNAKYMFKTFELTDDGQLEIIETIRKQSYHQ